MAASVRCQACATDLLRSFLAVTGHADIHLRQRPSGLRFIRNGLIRQHRIRPISNRQLHTSRPWRDSATEVEDETSIHHPDAAPIEASASSAVLPWYLQHEATQQPPPRSVSERQRLPELPETSPDNLQAILEHVSNQLGMEDMVLLDLRALDPAPALGGNLIMILCTARSDKHLHISADRFCRWLRTEYKMRPIADGLLGRNELKTKTRRQTRRTKLLSHVGRGPEASASDQLRSGWICVNVGNIESPREKDSTKSVEYVTSTGFSQVQSGTSLVIQMMTEDKREDLDLESLWSAHLERQSRGKRASPEDSPVKPDPEQVQHDAESLEEPSEPPQQVAWHPTRGSHVLNASHIQSRAYHTSPRRQNLAQRQSVPVPSAPLPITRTRQQEFMDRLKERADVGDYDGVWSIICAGLVDGKSNPISGRRSRLFLLQAHLNFLRQLPSNEERIKHLGSGFKDYGHTPDSPDFLYKFYRALPHVMEQQHWYRRMHLICIALEAGHPGYNKKELVNVYLRFVTTGQPIHHEFTEYVVETLLAYHPQDKNIQKTTDQRMWLGPTNEMLQWVWHILDASEQRGTNVLTERVWTSLVVAHCTLPVPISQLLPSSRYESSLGFLRSNVDRLWTLLTTFDIPLQNISSFHKLLRAFASLQMWTYFDRTWQIIPAHGLRRDETCYALMMGLRAPHCTQKEALKLWEEWAPLMEREDPEIQLTPEVALGMLKLLKVTDSELPIRARSMNTTGRERREVRAWRRCVEILQAAREAQHRMR